MRIAIIFSCLFLCIANISRCFCQSENDSAKLSCSLPAFVKKKEDLSLNIIITSFYKSRKLKINLLPRYGFKNDPDADIYFQVEKKVDSFFVICNPIIEYTNLFFKRPFSFLEYGQLLKFNDFNLGNFYHFSKGLYRFKTFFVISNFNNAIKDISTNWVEFEVLEDIKDGII